MWINPKTFNSMFGIKEPAPRKKRWTNKAASSAVKNDNASGKVVLGPERNIPKYNPHIIILHDLQKIEKTGNWEALQKGVSGVTDIPEIVSSGVKQTWNDPNTKQALINTGYSGVKAHVPLKVDIGLSILPVNISSGDKELDKAWNYVDYLKMISPSTANEVDEMWSDIKRLYKK